MPLDALQPKAYLQTLVFSHSYLHRQVSPPETLVMKGGTIWARNGRWILPENARLPRNIQGSFTYRESTTWDKRLYFPSEGVLRIFFALKNPTTSAGFEPANLGTKGQHATSRPPRPLPQRRTARGNKTEGFHPHTAPSTYHPRKYRIKIWVLVPGHNSKWQTSWNVLKETQISSLFSKHHYAARFSFVLYLRIVMLTYVIIQKEFRLQHKKTLNDPVNVRINRGELKYCTNFICNIRLLRQQLLFHLFSTHNSSAALMKTSSAAVLYPSKSEGM